MDRAKTPNLCQVAGQTVPRQCMQKCKGYGKRETLALIWFCHRQCMDYSITRTCAWASHTARQA